MRNDESSAERPRIQTRELVVTFDVGSSVRSALFEDDDATTRLPGEIASLVRPTVQGYRLERKLSCVDGLAVYHATHLETGAAAILKWLPRATEDYPRAVRALYTEAQLAQRFDHEGLTELVHADEDDAGCTIAYARPVGASTLSAVSARLQSRVQALPVGLAAHIVLRIARALDYVSSLRDRAGGPLGLAVGRLSPRVVMLDPAGDVRLQSSALRLVPDRSYLPTAWLEDLDVPYVAPECLVGEGWSTAAAVYAAGMILYELLAGGPAYPRVRPEALAARALAAGPNMDALAAEAVPDALVALTARALEREPAARIASPGALADCLEAWLQSAAEPGDPAALGRFLGTHDLLTSVDEVGDATERGDAPLSASLSGPLTSATLSAVVVGERPVSTRSVSPDGLAADDDDEATVRGDVALLEAALGGPLPDPAEVETPWSPIAPSPLLRQRIPVASLGLAANAGIASVKPSAPAPDTVPPRDGSEGEGLPTKRGHVIPALLLSPVVPEFAGVTAVVPPPAGPEVETALADVPPQLEGETQRGPALDPDPGPTLTPPAAPPAVLELPSRARPTVPIASLKTTRSLAALFVAGVIVLVAGLAVGLAWGMEDPPPVEGIVELSQAPGR